MKKIPFLIVLIIIFNFNLEVLASESKPLNDINAGITPESPFYKLDLFWERLTLKLTVKKEKKIEKLTNNANERLAEMNKIDSESAIEWIDKLYDEYGVSLQNANDLLAEIIYEDKISQDKIDKYQNKVEQTVSYEENISEEVKEKLNEEIQEKIKEVKVNSYLTVMPISITDEEKKLLKDLDLNPALTLRLYSLVNISETSIDEILEMDIFKENKKEQEIDFKKLEEALGLSKDELVEDLKDYQQLLKEIKKENDKKGQENTEEPNEDNQNGNNEEKSNQDKLNQIKDKIKDKLTENNQNGNGKTNKNGKSE